MSWRSKPRAASSDGAPKVRLEVLGPQARERIHEATLEVLGEVGVQVALEEAVDILDRGGCAVDPATGVVKFPRKVVEGAIETAPGEIMLCSRDGEHDYLMGGRVVGYTNFGEGTKVVDIDSGEVRDSVTADVGLAARLCDALPMSATCERAVAPNDAPANAHDVYAFEACLRNTTKHIHIGADDGRHVEMLVEIAAAVAGDEQTLRERPLFSLNTCPTSPLVLHTVPSEVIVTGARHGVPVNMLSMAMAGGSAPISLSGSLVTHNAEVLAGITLAQLTSEGTPVMYGSSTTAFDMTYATAPVGSPELALISAAVAEMSELYYLPCWVAGG